ncbi:hypothetical protein JHW43_006547 [Diplocarpon mali]|nr:hypothetical protein JHW43_006547 [Diplocarpon mali]
MTSLDSYQASTCELKSSQGFSLTTAREPNTLTRRSSVGMIPAIAAQRCNFATSDTGPCRPGAWLSHSFQSPLTREAGNPGAFGSTRGLAHTIVTMPRMTLAHQLAGLFSRKAKRVGMLRERLLTSKLHARALHTTRAAGWSDAQRELGCGNQNPFRPLQEQEQEQGAEFLCEGESELSPEERCRKVHAGETRGQEESAGKCFNDTHLKMLGDESGSGAFYSKSEVWTKSSAGPHVKPPKRPSSFRPPSRSQPPPHLVSWDFPPASARRTALRATAAATAQNQVKNLALARGASPHARPSLSEPPGDVGIQRRSSGTKAAYGSRILLPTWRAVTLAFPAAERAPRSRVAGPAARSRDREIRVGFPASSLVSGTWSRGEQMDGEGGTVTTDGWVDGWYGPGE